MIEFKNQLEREILGSFDLLHTASISTYNHIDENQIGVTYIHEEAHRKLVSSTSYGEVQQILAFLSTNCHEKCSVGWIKDAINLLRLTITFSFCSHEGFAVWRQMEMGAIFSLSADISILPEVYKTAFYKYLSITRLLPRTILSAKFGLARAVAETALNTPILYSVTPSQSFGDGLRIHLKNPLNQPDHRLDVICDTFKKCMISELFETKLLSAFRSFVRSSLIEEEITYNTFVNRILTQPSPENLALYEEWDKIETEIFFKEIESISLPFEIIHPNKNQKTIDNYHSVAKDFLKTHNINLYDKRQPYGYWEAAIYGDDVEYIPKGEMREIILSIHDGLPVIEKLLHSDELYFVIELSRLKAKEMKRITSDDFVYSAYLSLLRFTEIIDKDKDKKSTTVAFELVSEQYVLFGDLDSLSVLCDKIRQKAIVYLVEWATLVVDDWVVPQELIKLLSESGAKPLVVTQGTGSNNFLNIIKLFDKIGIINGTVYTKNERLIYFCLELSNGIDVVTKCSRILLNILKIHKLPEWEIIAPYLDSENQYLKRLINDPQKFFLLRSIAELDQVGCFYHYEL